MKLPSWYAKSGDKRSEVLVMKGFNDNDDDGAEKALVIPYEYPCASDKENGEDKRRRRKIKWLVENQ